MRTRAALAATTLALLATPAAAGLQARPAHEGAARDRGSARVPVSSFGFAN